MSHIFLKTKYKESAEYGSEIERELFVHHNLSCDIVSIYDDKGNCVFAFEDTVNNNQFDAIERLVSAYCKDGELIEKVEYVNNEERKKIFKR